MLVKSTLVETGIPGVGSHKITVLWRLWDLRVFRAVAQVRVASAPVEQQVQRVVFQGLQEMRDVPVKSRLTERVNKLGRQFIHINGIHVLLLGS